MWLEYVRNGLKDGQQVFRRSVIENLIEEIDIKPKLDPIDLNKLKEQLDRSQRVNRSLNQKFSRIKAILEEKD